MKAAWALVALALLGVALAVGLGQRPGGDGQGQAPPRPPMFLAGTPGAVLEDYVAADFAGERLERASWAKFSQWVIWRTEPAWDEAYVVREFRPTVGKTLPDKAEAEVFYDTLGVLNLATFEYEVSPTRQTVPFSLLRVQGTWKIGVPMLRPHPGAQATIAFLGRMREHYASRRGTIAASMAAIAQQAQASPPPP